MMSCSELSRLLSLIESTRLNHAKPKETRTTQLKSASRGGRWERPAERILVPPLRYLSRSRCVNTSKGVSTSVSDSGTVEESSGSAREMNRREINPNPDNATATQEWG